MDEFWMISQVSRNPQSGVPSSHIHIFPQSSSTAIPLLLGPFTPCREIEVVVEHLTAHHGPRHSNSPAESGPSNGRGVPRSVLLDGPRVAPVPFCFLSWPTGTDRRVAWGMSAVGRAPEPYRPTGSTHSETDYASWRDARVER